MTAHFILNMFILQELIKAEAKLPTIEQLKKAVKKATE
jgi:hypothetical protein